MFSYLPIHCLALVSGSLSSWKYNQPFTIRWQGSLVFQLEMIEVPFPLPYLYRLAYSVLWSHLFSEILFSVRDALLLSNKRGFFFLYRSKVDWVIHTLSGAGERPVSGRKDWELKNFNQNVIHLYLNMTCLVGFQGSGKLGKPVKQWHFGVDKSVQWFQ